MKKAGGMILIILGILGSVFAAFLLYVLSMGWVKGIDNIDAMRVSFVFVVILLIMIVLVAAGIRLIRGPRKKKERKQDKPISWQQQKPELSFLEQERMKEQAQISSRNYVPSMGIHIWKYRGQTSGEKKSALGVNGSSVALMVLAPVCAAVLAVLMMQGVKNGMDAQALSWIVLLIILMMSVVMVVIARRVGNRRNSRQLAFARDEEGRLYMFDYRSPAFQRYIKDSGLPANIVGASLFASLFSFVSFFRGNARTEKLIRLVDEGQIIERLMERENVYPYGNEIAAMESIRKGPQSSRVHCVVLRENGAAYRTSFVLSSTYTNFEELMRSLERLA